MSVEQYQRAVNRLEGELADLEKKQADLLKKESTSMSKINSIEKSISKNTSVNTLISKQKEIQRHSNDVAKYAKERSDISSKISNKRKSLADNKISLQKEEKRESELQKKQQAKLLKSYETQIEELTKNLEINIEKDQKLSQKGFYQQQYSDEEFDVFISHATEDKESFVNGLVTDLKERGFSVWIDTVEMTWGDSLRASIDNGLINAQFGIVVLSEHYISKGWTQYELEGLFQREMSEGKLILPIWHDITKDQVMRFSPTLAGRKALSTALFSTSEISDQLMQIFQKSGKVLVSHKNTTLQEADQEVDIDQQLEN